jgi:hypothetical protein
MVIRLIMASRVIRVIRVVTSALASQPLFLVLLHNCY